MSENSQIISSTKNSPEVILDQKGIIKMTGRLILENPIDFFIPIQDWIIEYFKSPSEIISIEIYLEYINSVGSKYLLDTLHEIVNIHLKKDKKKFAINWCYKDEDEDMSEKGRLFSSILKVPVKLVRII